MENLYYVVEKQLQVIDGFEETTGWKIISGYKLNPTLLILGLLFELEVNNSSNSIKEILQWLEENNISKEKYNLVQL